MKYAPAPAPAVDTIDLARRIRVDVLRMVHRTRASHVGSCFSMADMMSVLYGKILRIDPCEPGNPDRDRVIISKGHSAAAVYATLANRGFFPREWLEHYAENGSLLAGHVSDQVPGIELSTGSLGHGLPVGTGMALAARIQGKQSRTFVIASDGECDEGAVWEAALFAGHHGLDNLTLLVDYNKIQSFGRVSDVLRLEPFGEKWRSFGWAVMELDGHDHHALAMAMDTLPIANGKPSVLLCHTVKGKGVSFMEDKLAWHYKSPDDAQLTQALNELEPSR